MSKETGGPAFPQADGAADIDQWHHGMTLRQYAAIKLRVPDSGTDWLDEMIRRSRRDELAARAMQGLIAQPSQLSIQRDDGVIEIHKGRSLVPKLAYDYADAMLAEGSKP